MYKIRFFKGLCMVHTALRMSVIISLKSVNWLVFATDRRCFSCEIRNAFKYTHVVDTYFPLGTEQGKAIRNGHVCD